MKPDVVEPERVPARRERLEKVRQDMSASWDRALMGLSGGALSLSVLFYREIANQPTPLSKHFLLGAWISFAIALLTLVWGFFLSAIAHSRDLDDLDRAAGSKELVPGGNLETATIAVNVGSGLAFSLGIAMMLAFAATNLYAGPEMNDPKPTHVKTIPEGEMEKRSLPPRSTKLPTQPAQPPPAPPPEK